MFHTLSLVDIRTKRENASGRWPQAYDSSAKVNLIGLLQLLIHLLDPALHVAILPSQFLNLRRQLLSALCHLHKLILSSPRQQSQPSICMWCLLSKAPYQPKLVGNALWYNWLWT